MKIGVVVRHFHPSALTLLPKTAYEISKYLKLRGKDVTIISEKDGVTSPETIQLENGLILKVVENIHHFINEVKYDFWHFFGSMLGGVFFAANLRQGNYFVNLYSFQESKIINYKSFKFLRLSDFINDKRVIDFLKRSLIENLIPSRLLRLYFKGCKKIIVPSLRFEKYYSRLLGDQKVVRIEHGVNLKQFTNYRVADCLRLKSHLGMSTKDKVVLYLGHSYICRGIDDIIYAFPRVLKCIPNAKLVLVLNPIRDSLMSRVKVLARRTLPFEAFRIVEKYVNDSQNYYGMADVIILPYRFSLEIPEYPFVLLEGMASGKPIITTPIGAIPEIIKNGKNGLFVCPKDYRGLADAIVKILIDSSLAAKIGKSAQESVKVFDWKNSVAKIDKIYSEVNSGN